MGHHLGPNCVQRQLHVSVTVLLVLYYLFVLSTSHFKMCAYSSIQIAVPSIAIL